MTLATRSVRLPAGPTGEPYARIMELRIFTDHPGRYYPVSGSPALPKPV
ncbi:hypothetical protein GCM10028790_64690 [Micromonospora taraxaci]